MKKATVLFSLLFLVVAGSFAQRFAYVDTKYILEKMPEYTQAQAALDKQAALWQQEIDNKNEALKKMYNKYQAEEFLLSDDLKKERENEIMQAEEEVKELQKQRFGFNGDLFTKRQELIQPVQDKVFDAVQKISEQRAYDFIFDKASGGATMLYTNPKYDISEEVIKKLGL
ncbi:MAG: OmpH family outer membrane protein [Chitinophagales bacterium]|nr:OmpH family outer membrane protein [Chitinophagales bacterium]